MRIKKMIASATLVTAGIASSIGIAPSANASTSNPEPTPGQTIVLTARVTGSAIAGASGGAKVTASASTYDYVAAQVMSKAKTNSGSCYWSPGWNYNPGVGWHYETTPMKVCKLAKPRMVNGKWATYLKKGGGASGSACNNFAVPTTKAPSKPSPLVLDLRMGQRGTVRTSATAAANTTAAVNLFLSYTYNGKTFTTTQQVVSKGAGRASASDKATFKMSKRLRVKTTGGTINKAVVRAQNKAKAAANSKANADAKSKAEASAELKVTIVIPPEHDECPDIPGNQPVDYECNPPVVHKNPIGEIFVGEHAVDQGGTMPVFGRAMAFDGAVVTLGSPKVTPADLGGIYNWRTVSTERDGVTPCATGWVCYQGYFRLEKAGTPGSEVRGTMVATAKDNKDGSFTTEPLEFKAAYIAHPET